MKQVGALILTHGIPRSGKTTWAKQQVTEHPDTIIRINRDDLRAELFGQEYFASPQKGKNETQVTELQHSLLKTALDEGKTVICDDTNLNPKIYRELVNIAQELGANIEQKYFDTPVPECFKRNEAARIAGDRYVPPFIIASMARKAYKNGHLKKIIL